MNYIKNIKPAFRMVYYSKWYYAITIIFSLIVFSLNAIFRNYKLLWDQFSFSLLFNLIRGTFMATSTSTLVSLIIISLLSGIILSFTIYLIKRQVSSSGVSTSISSILVAIVAPACPSCAVGLFGVVGLGGLISYLPFRGAEIGPLAILLIAISLGYLSKKVVTNTCGIKP